MIRRFLVMMVVLTTMISSTNLAAAVDVQEPEPLTTVPFVDLQRYMGTWYEIASFPKWFSKGCVNSTATYTPRDDGRVDVLNQCHSGAANGRLREARAIATVVNKDTNAELKVQFFWPFNGDYWIIELGDNYEYAVVSDPSRKSLWILSRAPEIDQTVLEDLMARLVNVHGFDLSALKFTRGEAISN